MRTLRISDRLPGGQQVTGEKRANKFRNVHVASPTDLQKHKKLCRSGAVARKASQRTRCRRTIQPSEKAIVSRQRDQSRHAKRRASSQAVERLRQRKMSI